MHDSGAKAVAREVCPVSLVASSRWLWKASKECLEEVQKISGLVCVERRLFVEEEHCYICSVTQHVHAREHKSGAWLDMLRIHRRQWTVKRITLSRVDGTTLTGCLNPGGHEEQGFKERGPCMLDGSHGKRVKSRMTYLKPAGIVGACKTDGRVASAQCRRSQEMRRPHVERHQVVPS